MTKDISKEILDAVKATLPETQVGLIKEALQERGDLKEEVEGYRLEAKENEKELQKAQKEVDRLGKLLKESGETEKGLQEQVKILGNENKRLVEIDINRRAELAEGKLEAVRQTQEQFLKNTIVREKVQHQVIDEYPHTVTEYENGYNKTRNIGTSKTNRQVTDSKESTTDTQENIDNQNTPG